MAEEAAVLIIANNQVGAASSRPNRVGQLVADVSLTIPAQGPTAGPMLTRRELIVMEMTQVISGVEALIGLDALPEIKLALDGSARPFTLDF